MEQVYRGTEGISSGSSALFSSVFVRSIALRIRWSVGTLLCLVVTTHAETIALWTFDTNTPPDISNVASGPTVAADFYIGVGSATATGVHVSPNSDWTTPAGNGSANAFSSTVWAAGDYYEFTLSTANFEGLSVTWDQTRSNTGPSLFDFAYSLDGTNFTTFLDDYTVPVVTWSNSTPVTTSSFFADLSGIPDLNNAASVTFRLIAAAPATRTTGTNRVDNFLVSGSVLTSSTNSLFWDANGTSAGLGGSGNWNAANWADADSGSATVRVFDPEKKAVFSGTGGTVLIDSADAVANNGVQFDSDAYTIGSTAGGGLILGGAGPSINVVSAGHRATISATISGSNGFTKFGDGTLLLDADNNYAGQTTITDGVIEITRDRSLGAKSAGVALNGGTLRTIGNLTLNSERDITGTGTLDIATGTTLTVDGMVNASGITFTGGGIIQLNGAATFSRLALDSATTIHSSASLNINGDITLSHTGGTSTITAPVNFGRFTTSSGNRVVTVTDADATLVLAGALTLTAPSSSNNGRIHKLGAGTLELTGDNSALAGVRLGSAATSRSNTPVDPVDGGTLRIDNANALGTGTFQFNAGTLHIARPLVGANAIANAMTLGASADLPAVISGADVEFTGEVQLFRPNADIQHMLIVNTNVLFSGPFNDPESTSGFSSGLTIGGTGSLTLAAETNTVVEFITIDGPSVILNGSLSANFGVYVYKGSLEGNGSIPFGMLFVGDGIGENEAIFSPGDGITTYELGALNLDVGAVLQLQLDSRSGFSDRLFVDDTIYLGEGVTKLELTDFGSGRLPIGFEFTLIENGGFAPIMGYFAGMPHLHRFTVGQNQFEIDYGSEFDASNLVLRVVPEPDATALLLVGTAVTAAIWRRPRAVQK